MPVNPYVNNFPSENRFNNEHMVLEDLIVESIQMMGHNVYFIPRESLDTIDYILGETTKVRFHHAYLIEAYIANVEGFQGDGDFFSKFGLEIRDTSNFILSRRSFNRIVPTTLRERPQEGDLVWVPVMHRMFEIKFIEKKLMFFSLGNRHPFVYEMRCEDFRYNNEAIDTGVEEIDDVERENAFAIRLDLTRNTALSTPLVIDEVVYQSTDGTLASNTATGIVKEYDGANNYLYVYEVSGDWRANANVYGVVSQTNWRVTTAHLGGDLATQYDMADNDYLNSDTTLILDLSELNVFGAP